jgi:hypothetical protein
VAENISQPDDADDLFDPRPLHERVRERDLERLRTHLQARIWSTVPDHRGYSPAAYIIAGLDPYATTLGGSHDIFGWAFLPGGLQKFGHDSYPPDAPSRDQLDEDIKTNLRILTDMLARHGPDRPATLIAFAVQRGALIPWLHVPEAHEELATMLGEPWPSVTTHAQTPPPSGRRIRSVQSATQPRKDHLAPEPKSAESIRNSRKAILRWTHDDKRKVRFGAGKDAFQELRAQDFKGFRRSGGSINQTKVAKHLYDVIAKVTDPDDLPSFRTVADDVAQWIREDKLT